MRCRRCINIALRSIRHISLVAGCAVYRCDDDGDGDGDVDDDDDDDPHAPWCGTRRLSMRRTTGCRNTYFMMMMMVMVMMMMVMMMMMMTRRPHGVVPDV